MKKSKLLIGALSGLGFFSATAQELSIDAMIRPRFEYRHGFQDPAAKDQEPAAFVSQRSSLITKYSDSKITALIDFQDVSVWGDRPQLAENDDANNQTGFGLNRAWAQVELGNGWATKVGRQFISYDDQRIFGALGWQQQQRTHDAALLRYSKEGYKVDVGFAFNQERDGGNNSNTLFSNRGAGAPIFQYKAMQYVHVNKKWDNFTGSFLFLNNAFQDAITTTPDADGNPVIDDVTPGTTQRQMTGVYGNYAKDKFGLTFSTYYQFGEFGANDISAYQANIFASYKPSASAFKLLGAGVEILSGNDERTIDDGTNNAFFPLFGTNHKFNGLQDFFYVGRFANNVGLIDINAKAVLKTGATSKLVGMLHYFNAAADLPNDGDGYLGTAIDLVFVKKINSYANLKIGYSQSFLSDDFLALPKGGATFADPNDAADVQNWGWVMLTVNPNLFKWKKPVETK